MTLCTYRVNKQRTLKLRTFDVANLNVSDTTNMCKLVFVFMVFWSTHTSKSIHIVRNYALSGMYAKYATFMLATILLVNLEIFEVVNWSVVQNQKHILFTITVLLALKGIKD
ncbi:CLUMA_CG011279, isoform A [Clunio marinus]|uniref:CLUMA_CG011279, isoform A n=1 Tax=Clunio marinus TaxID=568069 RepID=A0A1J1ICE9_9DIPT|nr:CLUMA_CG011279, isoform A [Clunio marinus]